MDVDLDHVAIALERWEDGWPLLASALGGSWVSGGLGPGFSPSQLRYANGMRLELLAPNRVDLNDFLRRFLDRSGPGPHHLTFKVPDLDEALEAAASAGYDPIGVDKSDPEWHEAFVHPKQATGIVVQIAAALGPPWSQPPPEGFPAADPAQRASLRRVVHAVADLDEGLRLFAGLRGGRTVAHGEGLDAAGGPETAYRWIDLAWPGPGRLRLVTPGTPGTPRPAASSGPLAEWIGGGTGRLHHLEFSLPDPARVPGAVAVATDAVRDGGGGEGACWEVPPSATLGTRLRLFADAG